MKQPVYWTTRDGTKMNVDDMDENHVRNAFKMVLRNIEAYEKELKKPTSSELNGDMAQEFNDAFDNEVYDPNWD